MTPEQEMELMVLRTENDLLRKSYEQLSLHNANMSDRMQASAFSQARMDRLDKNLATVIDAIAQNFSWLQMFSTHFEGQFKKNLREMRHSVAHLKPSAKTKKRPIAARKKK